MPPSVVLTAVFFLMRPMVAHVWAWARGVVPSCARSIPSDRDGVTVVSIWSHKTGEQISGMSEEYVDGTV
jgi:hypothetical protein